MIGVVLARGAGRRMREPGPRDLTPAQAAAASAGRKVMMPIGVGVEARPFLDYVLASLADAGCDRIAVVIAPDQHDVRDRYERTVRPSRFELWFAEQPEASGTAHAVLAVEPSVGRAAFLVVNADNLYPASALAALVMLDGPGLPAFSPANLVATSNISEDRLAAFALIDVDEDGFLRRIVEKPEPSVVAAHGATARVSMNAWRFDHRIFAACRDVARSPRGEYELPEAVGLAVARGVRFRVNPAEGPVLDLSRQADIAAVSRSLAGREVRL
jgi:glucose-1-phosphate thymidylyltransferase